jgi:hypothetical protein
LRSFSNPIKPANGFRDNHWKYQYAGASAPILQIAHHQYCNGEVCQGIYYMAIPEKELTHYAAACFGYSEPINWPESWQLLKAATADSH